MKDYINHKPQPPIHWTDNARVISEIFICVISVLTLIFLV